MISESLDEFWPLPPPAFVFRDGQRYSTREAAKKLGVTRKHFEGASVARTASACRTAGPTPATHQGRRNRRERGLFGDDGQRGLQLLRTQCPRK